MKRKLTLIHKLIACIALFTVWTQNTSGQNCSVNAGVDFPVCANSALALSGGKTGLFEGAGITTWSQVTGPSSVITDPSNLLSTVTSVVGGNVYRFRLSATCMDGSRVFDEVSVTVNPITVSNAGLDQTLCPGTGVSNLTANSVQAGETGAWTVIGTNNGVTIVTSSLPTSSINLNAANSGNTTLRWTVNNASCSSTDNVIITNRGGNPIVSAGSSPSISACYTSTGISGNASASFGGAAGGQGGTWTVINGPNIPVITTPNSNITTFSNLIEGTYTFRWTVSGACVNGTGQVNLVVPASNGGVTTAAITSPGATVNYCDGRTAVVLTGNLTTKPNETVAWTKITGAAGDIIESPTSTTTLVSNLTNTSSYTYRYTISNSNGCTSIANRTINWVAPPSLNITTANPLVLPCGTSSATINYTAGGSGTTQWMILSGPTTPSYPTIPNGWTNGGAVSATINGLTRPGTYQIRFQKSAGAGSNCETILQDFTIVVAHAPTASNAGTDQVLACNVFNTNLVGNIPTVGSGMWTQVSGPNQAILPSPLLTISPISGLISGKYTFRWLIFSGNSCSNNQDDVSVIVSDPSPTASAVGFDFETCNSIPVLLTGNNTKINETGTWTVIPSSGVTFSNIHSPSATANGLGANTVYTFRWTINNACGVSSDDVIITTNATAGAIAAWAGNDQCQPSATNSITMAGNNPSPGVGTWTIVSGGPATITDENQNNTTITGLVDGTYLFEWSISNGGCAVTRDTLVVTISTPVATANPANAGIDQNVCGTSTTLAGNNPTVGTGFWVQTAGPGGAIITDSNTYNTSITGLTSSAYKFQWTISNYACTSSSDEMQINVSSPPTAANAGSAQSICSGAVVTMAGNTITSGTGIWTVQEGPNVPTITSINSPSTTITGLTIGSYTFRWRSYSGAYCPVSTSDVIVDVTQPASAGADQPLCAATSANLTGNSSTVGTWTQIGATPNVALITLTAPNTATASGLITGTYNFRYTYDSPTLCQNFDEMAITISAMPNQADAGPDQNVCDVNNVTMAGNAAIPGIGAWSRTSGPNTPTIVTINSPTTTIGGATALTNGTYVYRWTITNGSCTTSDEMIIIRGSSATIANAGADQPNICGTSATMAANNPSPGVGSWSQISGNSAIITQTIVPTTTITGMAAGTYTFRWSITNGTCSASDDDVTITTYDLPTTANAGLDQTLCGNTSATLDGNSISTGSGLWTQISGPNTASFTLDTDPLTSATGLINGTYVFRWTSTNGTCTSFDNVSISVVAAPTISDAGDDQDVCLFTALNLEGNTPTVGTGSWTQLSGPSAIIQTLASPTSALNGIVAGTYSFRWTISSGTCTPSTDDVTIVVNDIPSIALAGADQNLCSVSSTTLAGTEPTTGIGSWSFVSGPNTPTIADVNTYNSNISNLITGTYVLDWIVANGPCTSTDQMEIRVYAPPSTSDAGDDRNVCGTTSVILDGNSPSTGNGTWTRISGPNSPTIVSPTLLNTNVTGLITGTYVFRWTISNGSCAVSIDNVQISVITGSVTTANAGSDQTGNLLCGQTSATLGGNDVTTPESGIWTIQSGSGGSLVNSNSWNSGFNGTNGNSYTLRWTISNGACTSFDDVNISFPQNPTIATANDQTGISTCGITSTILDGNTPSVGTGSWSIVSGIGGLLSDSNDPISSFSGTVGTTYTLKWSINNAPCNASEKSINILFKSEPTAPVIGARTQPDCATSTGSVALSGLPSTGSWTINESVGSTTITGSSTTATFIGLSANNYTFRVINDEGCISPASLSALINAQPATPGVALGASTNPSCSGNGSFVLNFTNVPDGLYTITHDAGTFSNINIAGNTATISAPEGTYNNLQIAANGCTSSTGNNVVLSIANCADLSLVKSVDLPIADVGTNVEFSIVVTNNGPNNATNVVVDDILPTGYTFVSATPSIGTWSAPLWTIGTLANGSSETLRIIATVNTSGNYINTAYVTGTENDPTPDNNEDDETVTPNHGVVADLSIAKQVSSSVVMVSSELMFILEVTNNGPDDATGVSVMDLLPDGFTYISDNGVGAYDNTTGIWDIGNLAFNQSEVLHINARANMNGDHTNRSTVTANEYDPILVNNESQVTVTVIRTIIVPEGISPNNDGKNDKWEIIGLDQYPDHKVLIFNRWGNKVYEASPYLNDWDGTNMFGVTVGGKDLPVGTYFYIIDPGEGEKVIKGYIYLNR